ncbi:MAG: hypothetical protein KJ067_12220 [Vicinamibacteria bacterium]|jgi:RNA polymerase sigma factor (sigma-70 family)|nr:hypothetical protein [Vicinamibacteria bacterium]
MDHGTGGPRGHFPATRLSVIESLRAADEDERRRAAERLAGLYWKPLYKYLRLRWRRDDEDAKDLVQGFFAVALERESIASFDPGKASLRTFLRVLLDRYVANERKGARRLKRGGGLQGVDFDAAEAELGRLATAEVDAERLLHREWVRSLFEHCVLRLREELCGSGREAQFRAFEACDLGDGEKRPSYRELASLLGVTETTVTNHLAAARRRFRALVLATLRETTASEAEFRSEARAVLGVEP